jgi:cell division protein FtsQ
MTRPSASTATARSWRDIPQEVAPRSMSAEGRRRLVMGFVRTGVILVVLAGVTWAAWEVWRTWRSDPTRLAAPVKTDPLKTVTLRTDGVLDQPWLEARLDLPDGVTLMELDLPALQRTLLRDGQVRSAVLVRTFPDTLVVTIQERMPVARLRAVDAVGVAQDYLVARDGVIFAGSRFDPLLLAGMPWLDGVTLTRTGDGFAPVAGMETLTELLATAQANVPRLYRSWRVVSLARLALDGEIVVRSDDVQEIVFGLRDDFYTQIALLDLVLAESVRLPGQAPSVINLSLGRRQVPVVFGPRVGTSGQAGSRPAVPAGNQRPFFSITLDRSPSRDL